MEDGGTKGAKGRGKKRGNMLRRRVQMNVPYKTKDRHFEQENYKSICGFGDYINHRRFPLYMSVTTTLMGVEPQNCLLLCILLNSANNQMDSQAQCTYILELCRIQHANKTMLSLLYSPPQSPCYAKTLSSSPLLRCFLLCFLLNSTKNQMDSQAHCTYILELCT